jgi:dTDP-4-dehydrorhamnose 3,5-epimerase
MHFTVGRGQTKLVRCASGAILDVLVDIRRGSPTFGKWEAFELTDTSGHQLYVPLGFAHGFCILSEVADVVYQFSQSYRPELERAIRWNDPDIGIAWPIDMPIVLSERDATAPMLRDIEDELTFPYP